jgi:aminoglycoside phosphotransferase (APT) family kinase protein
VTRSGTPGATSVLERPDFVRDSVWRRLDEGTEPPDVELVHHRHGILEYRFEGGRHVFAKPFPDAERASAAYEIQRALWEGGFGPESPYRVPEPIAYLPDERVILLGVAPGERLRELAPGDRSAWEQALRGAARWLAALHSAPHRLGPPDDAARRALHLARRVAQTAARRPELERLLARLLEDLATRSPAPRAVRPEVPTHGRYHPQHVYVTSDCVTVIDADRATPGDPAKDVGEFLHRLRADAMMAGLDGETADHASAVFVEEYVRAASTDLSALEFYWSYSVLFTLVARAGRTTTDDANEQARLRFYEAELAAIPDRVAQFVGDPS